LAINIDVSSNQLHLYQGYTLVDITPTGQTVYSVEKEIERNQQRNWETTLQILSLRTQPNIIKTDIIIDDVKNYQFGIGYTGIHKLWTFIVGVEYREIYTKGPDVVGLLRSDFKLTPITIGLTETAQPEHAMFYSSGPWNNIYFKTLANDK
jgi:hypothetical protein